ncbi:hypothetical protein [Bremerella alba]|uniref:Uncharacterized protein n=1 Tax=Bremerella alba TaxID=980252 RepID=A0A7V8V7S4_9BACT|nr:hypothetical protein [Bremerella alba]MBA2116524.1 hypothetical protein [Bremerella alba]
MDYDYQLNQLLLSADSEIWIIEKYGYQQLFIYEWLKRLFAWQLGDYAEQFVDQFYGRPGDLLYRWGDPATYLGPDASDLRTSFGQHGVNWIKRNDLYGYRLPRNVGVGNILFFNNGFPGGSLVQEIAPPIRRNGSYVQPAYGQPFEPGDAVWEHGSSDSVSPFLSSAQRLPTGNTLITAGTTGTMLEVTMEGTVVWKYVCPVANTSPTDPGTKANDDIVLAFDEPIPPAGFGGAGANMVFRAKRYSPNYRGFRRKDLSPMGELIGVPAPF